MVDHSEHLFSADGFMPHGMCYLWRPDILGLHVTSDALIGLAYFSIPFTLLYFVRKRSDLEFNWMFVCFAVFIIACGATHVMEIWTIWHPAYWLAGTIKAVTALASVPTAILLVKLVPAALRVPSPRTLRLANERLEREVRERQRAEGEVRQINEQLEARVAERTAQLEQAAHDLLHEMQERQRAQQNLVQQERLRALSQMANGIAHDINTALAPAALYAHSLIERDASLNSTAREYLGVIQNAIDDVAHTVSRMKEFSGARELHRPHEQVDLNAIIRQVIDLTSPRWAQRSQQGENGIHLEFELAASLPLVTGSPIEIRDALSHLVLNAADAMADGGTLTLRTRPAQDGQVLVEVIDTGIGMNEATRARCLEPFFTTKGERGSGLGLPMVYGMLERHRGRIEIESVLGRGTLVRVTLPGDGDWPA